jgi:arylsulfatase A-like enzyme
MVGGVRRRAVVGRAVVLGACLAACGRADLRGANVVVVGIDTLRADHVGAYGYPRPTTPRIDAFARDAVRFETAVSQSSWTTPGFASMFTGLVPSAHGAGDGRCPDVTVLDPRHPTLATTLRAAGYRTASFVSNVWVGAEIGLARGFDEHARFQFSEQAVDRAVAWLAAAPPAPFFLFVHVMDPHQPWIPTPEDAALFVDPGYAGPIGNGFMGEVKPEWTEADRRRIVDLYDGEIRWADRLFGRVLDALGEHDLERRTIVVVTSDHGEELFDHDRLGHGATLYDEVLLVPFLVRFPGGRPRGAIAQPVRTMDLFPTVLDAVGQPVPDGLDAVSLMPLVRGDEPPRTDVALAEYPCFASDIRLQALRTPTEKLIVSPAEREEALFDLVADPHERTDVASARPDAVAALRGRLAATAVPQRDGYHLMARGGAQEGVLRARLEVPGAFTDVVLTQAEPADRFRLRHDGKVLDVKLRLRTQALPTPRSDLDGISFRTTFDQPFVLRRLDLNGVPIPLAQVSLGDGASMPGTALPAALGAATRGIRTVGWDPPPAHLGAQPRVRISFVRQATPPKAVITPEMAERLRAMGYVQ